MSRPKPIRIVIVDEHDAVRRALEVFFKINTDLELVGEARDGEEAVNVCEMARPDVVLMDLVMPGMDGTTATRIIRERWPHMQVVALTSFQDCDLVHGVLQAGAIGYLLKNTSGSDLARAIRAAQVGQSTLAPEVAQVLVQEGAPSHRNLHGYDDDDLVK